ncbi:MAG: hypothetical protein AB7F74_04375 [Parvibaculaceae bacterium]
MMVLFRHIAQQMPVQASARHQRAAAGAIPSGGTFATALRLSSTPAIDLQAEQRRRVMGRGILLWLLGVPIPVIILIYFLFR